MEVARVASAMALRFTSPSTGPRLDSPWATPVRHPLCRFQLCSHLTSSSSLSRANVVRASEKLQSAAYDEDMETLPKLPSELEERASSLLMNPENKALLAVMLSLGLAFGSVEAARALGPEGPLVEEFWDNMRRYGLYFLTVFTGGLYSLVQPIFSLLRNPFTAIFTIAFLSGSIYLLYLVLNTMLGITAFNYDYA